MRFVVGIFLLCMLVSCSADTGETIAENVTEDTTTPSVETTRENTEYRYGTSYAIGPQFSKYTPPPRQGEASIAYFKTQNLTGNNTYVLIQFLSGKPNEATGEEERELYRDGVRLGSQHGNAVYARVPNSILTGKSYPFVRWMGFVEPEQKFTTEDLYACRVGNCTGKIAVRLELFEGLTVEQLATLNATIANPKSPPTNWQASIIIDASQVGTLAEFRNVRLIEPHSTPSLG